jgi:hypothetical protein
MLSGNVINDGNGTLPAYDEENRIVTDQGVTYSYDADGSRRLLWKSCQVHPRPALSRASSMGIPRPGAIVLNATLTRSHFHPSL